MLQIGKNLSDGYSPMDTLGIDGHEELKGLIMKSKIGRIMRALELFHPDSEWYVDCYECLNVISAQPASSDVAKKLLSLGWSEVSDKVWYCDTDKLVTEFDKRDEFDRRELEVI